MITPAADWSKTRDVYDSYEFSAPFTVTNRAAFPFPLDHSAVVVTISGGGAPRALASPLLNFNSTTVEPGQTVTFVSKLAAGVKVTAVRTEDVFAEASYYGVPVAAAPCAVTFEGAKPLRDAPQPQRGLPQQGSLVACGPADGTCR